MIYQPSMIENVFCSSYGDIPFEVDQVSNHQNQNCPHTLDIRAWTPLPHPLTHPPLGFKSS
jgi:hypothetical protein